MKKRLRFGLVIGAVVVVLAIVGFVGVHRITQAASTLPGANCTASGNTVVDVTISNGAISSSLVSFSPGICYTFSVTNNDQKAYDFLIEQPGASSSVLTSITDIDAGKTGTVDYSFASALTDTPVNFVYTATGQQTPISTKQFFLAQ